MQGTKIFLVDDHKLLRDTLRMFLESCAGIEVVGEAGTCEDAVPQILSLKPEIILMDITLPDGDGIETTALIVEKLPQTKIIAVTMHPEEFYLMNFLEAGGVGYVHKSAADREILQAIEEVKAGKVFLSSTGVQVMAGKFVNQTASLSSMGSHSPGQGSEIRPEVLSDRERQVLVLISRGYNCREIGERLFLSTSTIETYKRRVSDKLQLTDRKDLVQYAIRYRLFEE